jgi:hypothetical protein
MLLADGVVSGDLELQQNFEKYKMKSLKKNKIATTAVVQTGEVSEIP